MTIIKFDGLLTWSRFELISYSGYEHALFYSVMDLCCYSLYICTRVFGMRESYF